MATPTYTALATFTASGTESEVTFSSISGYADLVIVINGNVTDTTRRIVSLEINGSTSGWSRVVMFPTSSATASDNSIALMNDTNDAPSLHICQIMDFDASDKHKTVLTRTAQADTSSVDAQAMRWANTAAGTSVSVAVIGYAFKSGTTVSVYGIAK